MRVVTKILRFTIWICRFQFSVHFPFSLPLRVSIVVVLPNEVIMEISLFAIWEYAGYREYMISISVFILHFPSFQGYMVGVGMKISLFAIWVSMHIAHIVGFSER